MSDNRVENVASIDIGSARTKVTITTKELGKSLQIKTTAFDCALMELIQAGDLHKAATLLEETLSQVVDLLRSTQVERVVVFGAESFRNPNVAALTKIVSNTFGDITVLSQDLEAALFHQSVQIEEKLSGFIGIDVGGGSVQLSWSDAEGESISAPIGTYKLEKSFQKDLEHALAPEDEAWENMANCVKNSFSEAPLQKFEGQQLVVGSNIMASFFQSAWQHQGKSSKVDGQAAIDLHDMTSFTKEIGGKRYEDCYEYFPEVPSFMHGADKLLVVIISIMELGKFESIIATNASVSKGVGRMLLEKPESLTRIGVKVSNWLQN